MAKKKNFNKKADRVKSPTPPLSDIISGVNSRVGTGAVGKNEGPELTIPVDANGMPSLLIPPDSPNASPIKQRAQMATRAKRDAANALSQALRQTHYDAFKQSEGPELTIPVEADGMPALLIPPDSPHIDTSHPLDDPTTAYVDVHPLRFRSTANSAQTDSSSPVRRKRKGVDLRRTARGVGKAVSDVVGSQAGGVSSAARNLLGALLSGAPLVAGQQKPTSSGSTPQEVTNEVVTPMHGEYDEENILRQQGQPIPWRPEEGVTPMHGEYDEENILRQQGQPIPWRPEEGAPAGKPIPRKPEEGVTPMHGEYDEENILRQQGQPIPWRPESYAGTSVSEGEGGATQSTAQSSEQETPWYEHPWVRAEKDKISEETLGKQEGAPAPQRSPDDRVDVWNVLGTVGRLLGHPFTGIQQPIQSETPLSVSSAPSSAPSSVPPVSPAAPSPISNAVSSVPPNASIQATSPSSAQSLGPAVSAPIDHRLITRPPVSPPAAAGQAQPAQSFNWSALLPYLLFGGGLGGFLGSMNPQGGLSNTLLGLLLGSLLGGGAGYFLNRPRT
ncbi:MAG: hypothetical protein KatS3mg087_0145 [Patescibacteria group bacterium]|nr:MAG: hypothetical protein KatS3mg087_0145 [Patescibacteria group bacterium]